ncbi:hypothetical protein [uncultured Metabacillus sp.]|uniref:hypothetical protein n=1 Tax=uncultured Metabacillus sp. TaxID=2860135 RepID=UPI00261447C5|nr:hypothetical protein [uncultured Metabacillus sp.]
MFRESLLDSGYVTMGFDEEGKIETLYKKFKLNNGMYVFQFNNRGINTGCVFLSQDQIEQIANDQKFK